MKYGVLTMTAGWFFILCVFAFIFFVPETTFAVSENTIIKKANKFYHEGKFDEALREYNEALTKGKDSAIINFNEGTAYYRKGDYENAASSSTKALLTDDKRLEAKADYNIGNAKYRAGILKENNDINTAINLFKQSLDYYKKAIEIDEKDEDAKFNYEFVEKKLKALKEKLKEQQKQQQKQQQDNQQEESPKEQQQNKEKKEDKENKKESQQMQEKQQPNKEGEKEEQKEKPKPESSETDKEEPPTKKTQEQQKEYPQQPQGSQNQQEPKEMSKEEANMLLEGSRQGEPRGQLKDMPRREDYPEVLKNW